MLPTAALKVESGPPATEVWPSSFPHHLPRKEESRKRPLHALLLTHSSAGLTQPGTELGMAACTLTSI